ncbi:hypothetical protein BH23GEM6_BH23GEM6_03100 [soil metagenome]
MILVFAMLLAAPVAEAADTLRVPSASILSSAYGDAAARAMVEGARERRGLESAITRYRSVARSRASIGMRSVGRERLLYRCESAIRVDWRRGQLTRTEVLGSREVVPMVSARAKPDDSDCATADFDPGDDRLSLASGGLLGGEAGYIRHPLAVGSEIDYRFGSGDLTTLRLPDGRVIRLRELRVIPRRSDSRLVSGSLWLEEESLAVVRAVLRLARPFDLGRDGDEGEESEVPAVFRPVRGDLRFLTIEYGLWDGRWWLPRLIAVEGEVQAGNLIRLPLRVEQGYSEYEIWSDSSVLPSADEPVDPRTRQCRGRQRPTDEDTVRNRTARTTMVIGSDGVSVEASVHSSCTCREGRCWEVERVVPADTLQLLQSEHLPPSIFDQGEFLLRQSDLDDLRGLLRTAAPGPWHVAPPSIRWGWEGLDLLRYNRVEGLSLAAQVEMDLGRIRVDLTPRLGVADLVPNLEFGASTSGVATQRRAAVYQRLETLRPDNRALGIGNSLNALLLGRDDGLYYRSAGAELLISPASSGGGWSTRIFAEHQRSAEKRTNFALPSLWGSHSFAENIVADEASQVGVGLEYTVQRGLDPTAARSTVRLAAEAAGGTFRYIQPSANFSGSVPVGGGMLAGVSLSGGTTVGELPTQRQWALGGPATIRGYDVGADLGGAFWLARAELARAAPGARLIVFSDAGRADDPGSLGLDPALISAGVGASVLDGLLRLDLSRGLRGGGWRLDLHLDAPL